MSPTLGSWFNTNFYILTKGGEEVHQAAYGKIAGAIAHKRGYMWLLNA